MNTEMSKREELSDSELDGVNGGFTFNEIIKAVIDAVNIVTGNQKTPKLT